MKQQKTLLPTIQSTENIFKTHSPTKSAKDSGSPESQIAHFTYRIKNLTQHLKVHKKDKNSLQRGLKKMVGKRKKLLAYLQQKNHMRYATICQNLSIKGIK